MAVKKYLVKNLSLSSTMIKSGALSLSVSFQGNEQRSLFLTDEQAAHVKKVLKGTIIIDEVPTGKEVKLATDEQLAQQAEAMLRSKEAEESAALFAEAEAKAKAEVAVEEVVAEAAPEVPVEEVVAEAAPEVPVEEVVAEEVVIAPEVPGVLAKDLKAFEAIKGVNELETAEAVEAYLAGEERVTILAAGKAHIANL